MACASEVVKTIRREEPALVDDAARADVTRMQEQAVDRRTQLALDLLSGGVVGLAVGDMGRYLEYVADQRLALLELPRRFGAKNPFSFMELQAVQGLAKFFERRVSAYQVGVTGNVELDAAF